MLKAALANYYLKIPLGSRLHKFTCLDKLRPSIVTGLIGLTE